MLDLEHVADLVREQEETIMRATPVLLDRFPIQDYMALLARYPQWGSYGYVSREVNILCNQIRAQMGEAILQSYNKLLLLHLIQRAPQRLGQKRVTPELRDLTVRNLAHIVTTIESAREEKFYTYAEDRFQKVLAICTLALIPAGAQKIHITRLPLRTLLLRAPLGTLRLLVVLRGIQPCFDMHTDSNDPDLLAEYTREGWIRFYRRTAEMLKLIPQVRCVFGSGWLFDPEMEAISPHLTYLRLLVTENGGHLLPYGASPLDRENATRTSRTRRRLVAEGRYTPTSYFVCWPRKPLLEWARRAT